MQQKLQTATAFLPNLTFITVGLFALLLALGALYAAFLNQTVMHIVERKNFEKEIAEINTQLGMHEFEYLTSKDSISLTLATSLGYTEDLDPVYVKTSLPQVALNENR